MEQTLYQKIKAIVEANPVLCITNKGDLRYDRMALEDAFNTDIFVWAPRPYGTTMLELERTTNGLQLNKGNPKYSLHEILSWDEFQFGAYLLEVKSFQNGEACGDLKMLTRVEKRFYSVVESSRVGYQIHGPNGSEL